MLNWSVFAISLLLWAGCAAERDTPDRYRGHLVWGHEVRSFEACDEGRAYWIVDRTAGELGRVYRALSTEPYQPLYVEFRARPVAPPTEGFGADYAQALEVLDLRRAARETAGCEEDLSGVEYLARGVEPFWSVEVRSDLILVRRLGRDDLRFPYAASEVRENTRTYHSQRAGDPPAEIEIRLNERPCIDAMSGERHPFEAAVKVDAATLEGCALEGWSTSVPAGDGG